MQNAIHHAIHHAMHHVTHHVTHRAMHHAPRTMHQVREMAETHDPGAMLDCMRAYHFGPKFLVEVEIVTANPKPSP